MNKGIEKTTIKKNSPIETKEIQVELKQESTKKFETNQMSTADEVLTQTGTYLRILKYLFHQMFIQDDVLTSGKKCNQFLLLVHNIIAKLYF